MVAAPMRLPQFWTRVERRTAQPDPKLESLPKPLQEDVGYEPRTVQRFLSTDVATQLTMITLGGINR